MERFTFFYETINVFRKIDYVSSYFNEILGPNHSYMKWTINGPFGTEHVKINEIFLKGRITHNKTDNTKRISEWKNAHCYAIVKLAKP